VRTQQQLQKKKKKNFAHHDNVLALASSHSAAS
jgi:hypothetical protein